MSAAADSRSSSFRDDSMTAAPLAERAAAMARPIPRDAPVTSATLPSIRMSMAATLGSSHGLGHEQPRRYGDLMNRLADETSPYLRQHADNPVDWFPWGDEAFARARELDRPVLLSVGYS